MHFNLSKVTDDIIEIKFIIREVTEKTYKTLYRTKTKGTLSESYFIMLHEGKSDLIVASAIRTLPLSSIKHVVRTSVKLSKY